MKGIMLELQSLSLPPSAPFAPPPGSTEPSSYDGRRAAAAWSSLSEPGDPQAGALLAHLGPAAALDWLSDRLRTDEEPLGAAPDLDDRWLGYGTTEWQHAIARWSRRTLSLAPEADLALLDALGGRLYQQGDTDFPAGVGELGRRTPPALWTCGRVPLEEIASRSVALIGDETMSLTGTAHVERLAAELTEAGHCIVATNREGTDAAALRGALAAGGAPLAVLHSGIDAMAQSPAAELLCAVADQGAVVTQLPPGRRGEAKWRHAATNRLVAALSRATVVVEAGPWSSTLSTARAAASLGRRVGVVLGNENPAGDLGCLQLLREGLARRVVDTGQIAALVGQERL